jgi:LAS superfamily LD-carboxypeptidase LdcB
MASFRDIEYGSFGSWGSSPAFHHRRRRRPWWGQFGSQYPQQWQGAGFGFQSGAGPYETSSFEYESESSDGTLWTNSPEQQAFRQQVLDAHLARSRRLKGLPQPDLTDRQLAPVHGTSVTMRPDAAAAADHLFEAANADLASAQAAGDADALRTRRLTANSGYRGSDHQRSLWLGYFRNYYNKTRKQRAAIADGPHSAKAVSYMLDVFNLPNRIAAPGYSNHQGGIAIDFMQDRAKGYPISNSYEEGEQRKWRATWFFDWLQRNAARFGFKQYKKEAWHWEYRPDGSASETSPALSQSGELEFESGPAGARPFLGGFVHSFTSRSLNVAVSVFCPKAAVSRPSVEILVYAHGLLSPCPPVPKKLPEGFITAAPFNLGQIVDATNRGIILVVPFFDWKPRQRHALGRPANLNALMAEVLAEVGSLQGGAQPSLTNLILAGHSRAYDFLEPLAASYADPEMRQGALATLTQVWALDTTYACEVDNWMAWLRSNPNLKVSVFFRDNSYTAPGGRRFLAKAKASAGRLTVVVVNPAETHCELPVRRLPGLLGAVARPEFRELESMSEEFPSQGASTFITMPAWARSRTAK